MTGIDHHDHERIVEVARVPTRFEAEVLVAALEARGIKATPEHGEVGGWMPQLALKGRHRVLVFESDLEVARSLIAQENLTDEGSADADE